MTFDPRQLVLLVDGPTMVELALVKGLLDTEGIPYVVQGEHHAGLLAGPLYNAAIRPRLLVREGDLDRARALLEATPVHPAGHEPDPGGTECAVHGRPARRTCVRCGSRLCEGCRAVGDPPTCESCARMTGDAARPSARRRTLIVLVVLGVLLGAPLLVAAVEALTGR